MALICQKTIECLGVFSHRRARYTAIVGLLFAVGFLGRAVETDHSVSHCGATGQAFYLGMDAFNRLNISRYAALSARCIKTFRFGGINLLPLLLYLRFIMQKQLGVSCKAECKSACREQFACTQKNFILCFIFRLPAFYKASIGVYKRCINSSQKLKVFIRKSCMRFSCLICFVFC